MQMEHEEVKLYGYLLHVSSSVYSYISWRVVIKMGVPQEGEVFSEYKQVQCSGTITHPDAAWMASYSIGMAIQYIIIIICKNKKMFINVLFKNYTGI